MGSAGQAAVAVWAEYGDVRRFANAREWIVDVVRLAP
jgi:hypothetical protein